jgi:hypothetical protein
LDCVPVIKQNLVDKKIFSPHYSKTPGLNYLKEERLFLFTASEISLHNPWLHCSGQNIVVAELNGRYASSPMAVSK